MKPTSQWSSLGKCDVFSPTWRRGRRTSSKRQEHPKREPERARALTLLQEGGRICGETTDEHVVQHLLKVKHPSGRYFVDSRSRCLFLDDDVSPKRGFDLLILPGTVSAESLVHSAERSKNLRKTIVQATGVPSCSYTLPFPTKLTGDLVTAVDGSEGKLTPQEFSGKVDCCQI